MSSAFVVVPAAAAPSSHSAPSVTTTRHLNSPGSLGTMTLGAGVLAAVARRAAPRRNAVVRRALTGAARQRATPVTARHATTVVAPPEEILGIKPDAKYNVPAGVREKLGKNLLLNEKLGNYNCDKLEPFLFVFLVDFFPASQISICRFFGSYFDYLLYTPPGN